MKKVLIFLICSLLRTVLAQETLDGIPIQAVENPYTFKNQQISLLVGIYPFDPYYRDFAIGLSFTTILGTSFSWRVLRANYLQRQDTDIRLQLAEKALTPVDIDQVSLLVSSDILFHFAKGKFLLLNELLRRFELSLSFGIGAAGFTSSQALNQFSPTINAGLQLQVSLSESFLCFFDVVDYFSILKPLHIVTFSFGTGFNF